MKGNPKVEDGEKSTGSRAESDRRGECGKRGRENQARGPIDLPPPDCEEMRRRRRKRPPNLKARQDRAKLGVDRQISL